MAIFSLVYADEDLKCAFRKTPRCFNYVLVPWDFCKTASLRRRRRAANKQKAATGKQTLIYSSGSWHWFTVYGDPLGGRQAAFPHVFAFIPPTCCISIKCLDQ